MQMRELPAQVQACNATKQKAWASPHGVTQWPAAAEDPTPLVLALHATLTLLLVHSPVHQPRQQQRAAASAWTQFDRPACEPSDLGTDGRDGAVRGFILEAADPGDDLLRSSARLPPNARCCIILFPFPC